METSDDFQLIVKSIDPGLAPAAIIVNPNDTVLEVKQKIEASGAFSPRTADEIRLIWCGKDLAYGDYTMHDYRVKNNFPMHVVFRIRH